jgi:hypothetical protein
VGVEFENSSKGFSLNNPAPGKLMQLFSAERTAFSADFRWGYWRGGYAVQCAGTFEGKVGGIQVLAGLAPSSQTIGCNIWTIRWLLPGEVEIGRKRLFYFKPDPKSRLSLKTTISLHFKNMMITYDTSWNISLELSVMLLVINYALREDL